MTDSLIRHLQLVRLTRLNGCSALNVWVSALPRKRASRGVGTAWLGARSNMELRLTLSRARERIIDIMFIGKFLRTMEQSAIYQSMKLVEPGCLVRY